MTDVRVMVIYPYGNNVEYLYDNLEEAVQVAREENDDAVRASVTALLTDPALDVEDCNTDYLIENAPYVEVHDYFNDNEYDEVDFYTDNLLNIRTEVNKALGRDENE